MGGQRDITSVVIMQDCCNADVGWPESKDTTGRTLDGILPDRGRGSGGGSGQLKEEIGSCSVKMSCSVDNMVSQFPQFLVCEQLA